MAQVFVCYRLKPGVTREVFESWSRERDQPALNSIARVKSFRVFRTEQRLMAEGVPTYRYIELIDIPDLPGFLGNDIPGPVMQDILGQFAALADGVEIVSATEIV